MGLGCWRQDIENESTKNNDNNDTQYNNPKATLRINNTQNCNIQHNHIHHNSIESQHPSVAELSVFILNAIMLMPLYKVPLF
jgi:hypothetical protein